LQRELKKNKKMKKINAATTFWLDVLFVCFAIAALPTTSSE